MGRGPSTGYIYGIKDPYSGKYVFVGNGMAPWISIRRHLLDSSNEKLKAWAKPIMKANPKGVQVLGSIICERWELAAERGVPVEELEEPAIPVNTSDLLRIDWDILGFEAETPLYPDREASVVESGTLKFKIIKQLLEEGHPLVNGHPGRRATNIVINNDGA